MPGCRLPPASVCAVRSEPLPSAESRRAISVGTGTGAPTASRGPTPPCLCGHDGGVTLEWLNTIAATLAAQDTLTGDEPEPHQGVLQGEPGRQAHPRRSSTSGARHLAAGGAASELAKGATPTLPLPLTSLMCRVRRTA